MVADFYRAVACSFAACRSRSAAPDVYTCVRRASRHTFSAFPAHREQAMAMNGQRYVGQKNLAAVPFRPLCLSPWTSNNKPPIDPAGDVSIHRRRDLITAATVVCYNIRVSMSSSSATFPICRHPLQLTFLLSVIHTNFHLVDECLVH